MARPRAIAVALCLSFLVACSTTAFDKVAEERVLLARDAEWANLASSSQDVEKIVSYWTDDALVVPPGQPAVEGKDALRAFVKASQNMPGFRIHWASSHVTFSSDGRLAYMRGTNETTLTGPDGKPMTIPGRAITVWRKDADEQWRCAVDIWNEPPTAAPTSR
jgi:ketosteroid isomerase-like protein